jgi:hypothetical protein
MNTPEPQVESPRDHRHRYGVPALLVVVVLGCVAMSWFVVKLQQTKTQRNAVSALERAGVLVTYEWQRKGRQQPYGSRSLRKVLTDDFFNRPAEATLVMRPGTAWTEKALESLRDLPRLKRLALAEMPWLEAVSLSGNRLSQKAFDDLKKALPNARVTR